MPETRGERIIFWVGILAIAALVALIVLQKTTALFETRRAPTWALPVTTALPTTDAAAPESPAPTTSLGTGETTTAPEPARAAATAVRLKLSAIADTWIEVRSRSAGGNVLYSGILTQGSVERFRDNRVWVRFGAAANLKARLNGRPLHLLPGTYEALVRARGLKPLGA
jgi:Domain of unknown function (DUF4115)